MSPTGRCLFSFQYDHLDVSGYVNCDFGIGVVYNPEAMQVEIVFLIWTIVVSWNECEDDIYATLGNPTW